jgi:hypothetical protein
MEVTELTNKELDKQAKQEMFNKVWDWFIVKKNPPGYDNGKCTYRGENGKKCAFGVLIPDDVPISEEQNTETATILIRDIPILNEKFGPHLNFIRQIQEAHDGPSFNYGNDKDLTLHSIEQNLRSIASDEELTLPVTE